MGQALSTDGNGNIKKFYAYSVLLESSGKFLKIQPLANAVSKSDYLRQMVNSVSLLLDDVSNRYNKVVFHIPEKIKLKDIKEIEKVLNNSNTNISLYIIKINENSKFFGYDNNNNSLIPFESSYVRLSNREFLIWTEGLNYHNPMVRKRYGNPLYVEIFYSNSKEDKNYKLLLQDILNLSGANFRGFNAKALPVSIYYPKLIAKFNKGFEDFNLDMIIKNAEKPWFL